MRCAIILYIKYLRPMHTWENTWKAEAKKVYNYNISTDMGYIHDGPEEMGVHRHTIKCHTLADLAVKLNPYLLLAELMLRFPRKDGREMMLFILRDCGCLPVEVEKTIWWVSMRNLQDIISTKGGWLAEHVHGSGGPGADYVEKFMPTTVQELLSIEPRREPRQERKATLDAIEAFLPGWSDRDVDQIEVALKILEEDSEQFREFSMGQNVFTSRDPNTGTMPYDADNDADEYMKWQALCLSLIHISEPTRPY